MVEKLTLYTAKVSPCAHRVELALAETGVPHEKVEINLWDKPDWFASQVNPASQVPAIAYGGSAHPPATNADSTNIAESLVLLELIADLAPNSTLLPNDPVLRAKTRFFIEAIQSKYTPAWLSLLVRGEAPDALYKAYSDLQDLLEDKAVFAVGNNFTTADAAIIPFLVRTDLALKNDIGAYKEGEGTKIYEVLKSEKYAKINRYIQAQTARENFKSTYDEGHVKELYAKMFGALRAQKAAAKA